MHKHTITFIGGGNMARSLIGGLLGNGMSAEQLRVADVSPTPLVSTQYAVQTYTDNVAAIQGSDIVVLSVKPQVMREVTQALNPHVSSSPPLFISIAAGIRLDALRRWLGHRVPVVRVMPNTPALVGCSASALFASPQVTPAQRISAENILRAVGMTLWLTEESQMDAVTALSGSGPAYFFLVMEMLQKSATRLGLPAEQAALLTLQTAFGAAKMALESREDAAALRAHVTSKGGTTEQAIQSLVDGDLQALFDQALHAAWVRSVQLAEELGGDA